VFLRGAAFADGRSPTLRRGSHASATWIGGELLGVENAGTIREGGPAEIVLVHGDPLSDPPVLWRVWRVYHRGERVG
jgi:imidazolonepropionase-like amidohydrolase